VTLRARLGDAKSSAGWMAFPGTAFPAAAAVPRVPFPAARLPQPPAAASTPSTASAAPALPSPAHSHVGAGGAVVGLPGRAR
jgi:hypothetical protein